MVNLLKKHLIKYPDMQIQDIVKLIYQNELGCEHLVEDEKLSLAMINREYKSLKDSDFKSRDIVEGIGNGFCRISLYPLHNEKVRELLNTFFVQSAKDRKGDLQKLNEKLNDFRQLSKQADMPFDYELVDEYLSKYEANSTPAVHHSDIYRALYRPAYRVIDAKYAKFFIIYDAIQKLLEQKERVIVAIDGDSASGKTSLATVLGEIFDCNVFHMDDFFLQTHQHNEKRLQEVGGNVDYERFAEEIATPLIRGNDIVYSVYDCQKQVLGATINVIAKKLNIVEGAYCMRPEFQEMYDLKIFLSLDRVTQMQKIIKRNGKQLANRFEKEWIPLEENYAKTLKIKEHSDMVF